MPSEYRQPSGKMELCYEWKESASGHTEDELTLSLYASNDKVVLREHETHENMYKLANSSDDTREYSISPKLLAKIIKQNGEEL